MVWIPLRFQTNHSKTSIILVPTILIVLFRLGEAGVSTDQKKSLLSVSELDSVTTGLGK